MERVWWTWDEERGELRDGKGRSWKRVKEEVKRGKEEEEGKRESTIQGEEGTGMKREKK